MNKIASHYQFALISDTFRPKIMYELNKNFYDQATKKFGKIYFINLNKLIHSNKRKIPHEEKKKFSKFFHFIEPKNYKELKNILNNNKFIISVSLGRTFKFFKTWHVLKKTKNILFYQLNLGIISSKSKLYTKSNYENFKDWIDNLVNVKISFLVYRLLVLIRIFPNIDIVFEASKAFVDAFNQSPSKKIEKIFNLKNIAIHKKVIHINSRAYDEVIDRIQDIKEEYITFLDSGFDHPDRARFDKPATKEQRKNYYLNLNKILFKFSKLLNKKIIFCAHPKVNVAILKKYIPKIKIIKFKTRDYILKSKIIFFHESSSVLDAIILKKKIWCLKSNDMGEFFRNRNNLYPNFLKCPYSDMEYLVKMDNTEIINKLNQYNFRLFDQKIRNYLANNQKSVNYLNNCLKFKKKIKQKKIILGRQRVLDELSKYTKKKS